MEITKHAVRGPSLSEPIQNFIRDSFDLPPVGLDDQIGNLPVQRIPIIHQVYEDLPAVTILQERPLATFAGPGQLLVHGCVQIDDKAACA